MKLVGPPTARSPCLRLVLEIERQRSAEEIAQGRLIDLVAFADVALLAGGIQEYTCSGPRQPL
jgi:hypothetical protein